MREEREIDAVEESDNVTKWRGRTFSEDNGVIRYQKVKCGVKKI